MFRKIIQAFGVGGEPPAAPVPASADRDPPGGRGPASASSRPGAAADAPPGTGFRPYREEHCNFIYNLLFCDDVSLFGDAGAAPWLALLRADDPDPAALRAIADDDASYDSRIRMLAFNRLRQMGRPVPAGLLLGVIFEIGLDGGLDTLAAFQDGGVRYINHTGKMTIVEGSGHALDAQGAALLAASRQAVSRIGPWTGARLPPPPVGSLRMTFLVSDGLYFGQGPNGEMLRDPMAAPIFRAAFELLQALVGLQQPTE